MNLDYMFSADVFVTDMRAQAAMMVDKLGLHAPGPKAIATDSPEAHAAMLRIHRQFGPAPTRFEVIQPAHATGHWNCAHIQQAWRAQAERPVRFHNTVYIADTDALMQRWDSLGVPYVYDDSLTFRRVWVGISRDDIETYRPEFDAGLRTEFLPRSSFPLEDPTEEVLASLTGPIRRVAGRSMLTSHLDEDLQALARLLEWEPESVVTVPGAGVRRARFTFPNRYSAVLDLLEPTGPGAAGDFLAAHGPGAYTIALQVRDLPEWSEHLSAHEVPFQKDDSGSLVVEPGPVGDVRLEFVGEN